MTKMNSGRHVQQQSMNVVNAYREDKAEQAAIERTTQTAGSSYAEPSKIDTNFPSKAPDFIAARQTFGLLNESHNEGYLNKSSVMSGYAPEISTIAPALNARTRSLNLVLNPKDSQASRLGAHRDTAESCIKMQNRKKNAAPAEEAKMWVTHAMKIYNQK
jgi:hypothetical protein